MTTSEFTALRDRDDILQLTAGTIAFESQKTLPHFAFGNIPGNGLLTSITPRVSTGALSNTAYPWSDEDNPVYLINASGTYGFLERRLFADNVYMDVEGLYLDTNPDNTIAFHLDHYWDRIVYEQKSGNWIKSYGDHTGEYQFINPKGMSVDIWDTIYVADTDNNRIVKLKYNRSSSLIEYVMSFTPSGMVHPIDIAIDQGGSLLPTPNPANDRIWIVDDFAGKLIRIDRSGTVRQELTHYTYGPHTYRLNQPFKVQTQEGSNWIGVIDRERMAFVTMLPPTSGATATANNYNSFASSELTCIGLDMHNEWWVGDKQQRMYHKFTATGSYLASYQLPNGSPAGQFDSPVTISKAPYYVSGGTIYRSQYVFTSDLWGDNTGLRAFYPGADVLDLAKSGEDRCYYYFSFTLTNKSRIWAKVMVRRTFPTPDSLIYDFGNGGPFTRSAGINTLSLDRFRLGNETGYYFYIQARPTFLNALGNVEKTLDITSQASYFGVTITGTSCAPAGYYYTWTAEIVNAYQTCAQDGPFRYKWYISPKVSPPQWTAISGGNNKSLYMYVTDSNFLLGCGVRNLVPGGDSVFSIFTNCPPPPPPPSCPFVFTWDGEQFQEDNNILPQSVYRDSIGKNVVDYYRLMKSLVATNGINKLQIREDATERSLIDNFKLIAVDHPRPTNVIVSKTGEIIQYITPYGLQNAQLNLMDVTSKLTNADSMTVTTANGDSMSLAFGALDFKGAGINSSSEGGVLMEASVPCKDCEPGPDPRKAGYGQEILSTSAITTHRLRSSLMYIPFKDFVLHNPKLLFRGEMTVDVANLAVRIPASFQMTELPLIRAIHSHQGDVASSLQQSDSVYAILDPGESIELHFSSSPVPQGRKRAFILVSRGQYFTLDSEPDSSFVPNEPTNETGTTDFRVSSNYPNPFNPITKIDFQLPTDGQVKIVVYDIMGREVATLVDQKHLKGTHTFSWDAGSVASGMYFCRYFVTDNSGKIVYNDVKKMLLMR